MPGRALQDKPRCSHLHKGRLASGLDGTEGLCFKGYPDLPLDRNKRLLLKPGWVSPPPVLSPELTSHLGQSFSMPACEPPPPTLSCFCHLLSDFGVGSHTRNLDSSLSAFLLGAFAPAVLAAPCVLSLTLHLQKIPSPTSVSGSNATSAVRPSWMSHRGKKRLDPWL